MDYQIKDLLANQIIAHRGCWDKKAPENSLLAFKQALDKGLDIELDVHMTRDGTLAVFHDHRLFRMTRRPGIIYMLTACKLKSTKLKGTNQYIPTLKEVLDLVSGKVTLFIEIKYVLFGKKLCDALLKLLKNYKGKVELHGFNIKALKYLKKNSNYPVMITCLFPMKRFLKFESDGAMANIHTIVRRKSYPVVSWTINSNQMLKKAKKYSDAYMVNTYYLNKN